MLTRVLDTSVVAKWFLEQPDSDRADRYLDELSEGLCRVAVPSSLFYELAHVFWRQRSELGDTEAMSLWAGLRALPLTVVEWEEVLPGSLLFGFRHGISPHDAAFVLLAKELGCDMITADPVLWSNAQRSCPWVKLL